MKSFYFSLTVYKLRQKHNTNKRDYFLNGKDNWLILMLFKLRILP